MTQVILLGFGSSARRGATGWTDRARIRQVLDVLRPDATVDGASPAGGADEMFHQEALMHFEGRPGRRPFDTRRCPVDHAFDGPWPAAGHRRNARMYRTHKPSLAVGFISGAVGSPLSSGSAGMLRICRDGLHGEDRRVLLAAPCPVVVFRDDGIEPDLSPLTTMRRLYRATQDERLVPPGRALAMLGAPRKEILAALAYARAGSRWAPWIEAIEATVKKDA